MSDPLRPEIELGDPVALAIKPTTIYTISVGHSDFASFDQDGTKVLDPVFPYNLRYEPNSELALPDAYAGPIFDLLKQIPEGSTLYKVFALDKPVELGGQEQHIGNVVLESTLETSLWGDKNMFFRH